MRISFSDVSECPIDCFSYEIAVVMRLALDHRKKPLKLRVPRGFVLITQICGQGKCRALLEFCAPSAPFIDFVPRGLCVGVEITTCRVHHVPRVKITHPALHLRRG